LILAAFLVAWLTFAMFFDPDLLDDSDLALPERQIDPVQNPYPEIRNLVFSEEERDELNRVDAMYERIEPFDPAFLESMLTKHATTLERFERYAAMRDWRADAPKDFAKSDLNYLLGWVYLSGLKRVEAAHLASRGDMAGASNCALSLFDFGDRLQSAEVPLLETAMGGIFAIRGGYTMIDLLDHRRFDTANLDQVADRLDEMISAPSHFGTVLRAEYRRTSMELDNLSRARVKHPPGMPQTISWLPQLLAFKENRTRAMFASDARAAIKVIHLDYRTFERETRWADARGRFAKWGQALTGNARGYELFSTMPGGSISTARRDFGRRSILSLLQLRVAFERYRLRHGRWPESLEALLPDYLDAIPKDWMDGNPLRYNPAKRRIYSVGEDLIDADGEADKPGALRDRNEIVIELEPAEPTPWPDFSKRVSQPSE
jgi:hypothetical protein